jgi:phage protein D
MDVSAPIVLLEIEGKRLARDLTDRLVSFSYEDHEAALDLLEITLADPYLQFIDDPLLQEGNGLRARFGYVDQLCRPKTGSSRKSHSDPKIRIDNVRTYAYH